MHRHPALRRLTFAIAVAAVQPLVGTAALASDPSSDARPASRERNYSVEAETPFVPAGFDHRQQAIDERLAAGDIPAWAGRYHQGEGLGDYVKLTLAPTAGATMTWRGTFGLLNANHGAVVESADGAIRVAYVAPNGAPRTLSFPDEFVPIAWGERQYLVPPDRVAEFASAINHGDEPRPSSYGRFLMRAGDDVKPVAGLPTLPPVVVAHIRREAVDVRVTSAERTWRTDANGYCGERYRLRIVPVAPASPPLFVGEQLTMPGVPFAVADVTALHGESADAEFLRQSCEMVAAPKVGDRFTTGAYAEAVPAGR